MGFDFLLKPKKKRIIVKKIKKAQNTNTAVKVEIGSRKTGNPSKILNVELLNFQERNNLFKSGISGTVEIHLVKDLSKNNPHFRVLENSYDEDGNVLESEFTENENGETEFSSLEDALKFAYLDHNSPIFSGMGKSWEEEVPGSIKSKKMYFVKKDNGSNYSVREMDHSIGSFMDHKFDTEDDAMDFFLSD